MNEWMTSSKKKKKKNEDPCAIVCLSFKSLFVLFWFGGLCSAGVCLS